MHIRNAEDYEAALDDAAQRMDAVSRERGAEPSLAELLAAIEAYSPVLQAAAATDDGLSGRVEGLVARASDLQRLYTLHTDTEWSRFPNDGHGMGPTTGA